MSAALWTLLGLQLSSYWRYFVRSLATVKGALLAGVGVLFIGLYFGALLFSPSSAEPVEPDVLRRTGPAFLLLYCLVQVLLSASQATIYFTPAEVQFLFSGPFTRRQILIYKVTLLTILTLPVPLLFALFLRHHAGSWYAAMLAMTLGVLFLNLFTIACNLLVDTIGAAMYHRARSVALFGLLIGFGLVVYFRGGLPTWGQVGEQGGALADSTLMRVITWPLGWFFELFLASDLAALGVGLAMSVLVNVGMLLVVFALDKNLLELAAANSDRTYTMLQQIRRGQTALAAGGGKAGWSLPDFPYLAGVGPVVWRQLTLTLRGLGRLVVILLLIGGMMTFGVLGGTSGAAAGTENAADALFASTVGLMVMLTFFMTMLVPFDFRGDIDAMAVLKTLPVAPWALAVGQLLTPVLVTTLFHWGILVGMASLSLARGTPLPAGALVAMAFLFPALNFLMFGLENLLFLIFPIRMTQVTPGDFQSFGRNIVLTLGKMVALLAVLGTAALLGVFTAYATGNTYLGLGVGWLVVVTAGVALVPAIMIAFARFDVGRDTPP